jgi:hypothetical protein
MAVSLDQPLGTNAAAGSATITLTTAATVASLATILLVCGRYNAGTPTATLSAAGGGLTWTQDHTLTSGNVRTSVFSAPAPAGLPSGTVITVSQSLGTGDMLVGAGSFLGVGALSAFNALASGAGTAWATGTVAAASGDFLFGGAFGDGLAGTSTPTSPAVELLDANSAGQTETITAAYKLSVAGSDSIAGTWSGSLSSVGVGVSYTPSVGGAPAPPDGVYRYSRMRSPRF